MTIAFSCRRCATRFKVSDRLAGKKARCKKCGNDLRVPEATVALASVAATGLFRMGAVPAESPRAQETEQPASALRGPAARPPSLGLAPISLDDVKPVPRQRTPLWEEGDSVEYEMEKPTTTPAPPTPRHVTPSRSRFVWGPGGIAEVLLVGLRKISDLAYLVSVPFLLAILLAVILQQRELAIIAAVVVVLLNIARFCIDGFVLLTLAFKNGPVQGVLFLIPPFTFYYLSKRKVMKEAMGRFLGPALPIIGVMLLFAFVPWLRGSEPSEDPPIGADVPTQQDSQTQ